MLNIDKASNIKSCLDFELLYYYFHLFSDPDIVKLLHCAIYWCFIRSLMPL